MLKTLSESNPDQANQQLETLEKGLPADDFDGRREALTALIAMYIEDALTRSGFTVSGPFDTS